MVPVPGSMFGVGEGGLAARRYWPGLAVTELR